MVSWNNVKIYIVTKKHFRTILWTMCFCLVTGQGSGIIMLCSVAVSLFWIPGIADSVSGSEIYQCRLQPTDFVRGNVDLKTSGRYSCHFSALLGYLQAFLFPGVLYSQWTAELFFNTKISLFFFSSFDLSDGPFKFSL